MKAIATTKAPAAIGPYSQAIEVNGFLFVSGQLPIDPETGEMVPAEIKQQTERVFENIEAILASRGLTLSHVVKTSVFLSSMQNFPEFNETYSKFLSQPYPARSTVEVSRLPKDALVEIEVIAVTKD